MGDNPEQQENQSEKIVEDSRADQNKVQRYLINQQKVFMEFMANQNEGLRELGFAIPSTKTPDGSSKRQKRKLADDELSLDASYNDIDIDEEETEDGTRDEPDNENVDVGDLLSKYSKGRNGKGDNIGEDGNSHDLDDEGDDEIERERYKALLESTEEKMGPPLEKELAGVCQTIWGKAILHKDRKDKDDAKKILIPSNCPAMKTPRLNEEIYIKLGESAQNKDRAAQTKQKDTAKASVPILQAMAELKKAEKMMRKNIRMGERDKRDVKDDIDSYNVVKTISPILQDSLKVLNQSFSDAMRKRKNDVCGSLGDGFKAFATSSDSSTEKLFDDTAIKKMKSELKGLKTPKKYNSSKNYQGFNKSRRSFHHQGNFKGSGKNPSFYHNDNKSNNYNYYNNNNANAKGSWANKKNNKKFN